MQQYKNKKYLPTIFGNKIIYQQNSYNKTLIIF